MSEKGNGFALDEDVKEEIEDANGEDSLLGSWTTDGDQSDKLPLVEGWIPDSDSWQGKTKVNQHEARLFALARNLPKAYPEIEEMDGFIDGLFTDLEMYLTSIEGDSRQEQMRVLAAMFGSQIDEEDTRRAFMTAFAGQQDDDD